MLESVPQSPDSIYTFRQCLGLKVPWTVLGFTCSAWDSAWVSMQCIGQCLDIHAVHGTVPGSRCKWVCGWTTRLPGSVSGSQVSEHSNSAWATRQCLGSAWTTQSAWTSRQCLDLQSIRTSRLYELPDSDWTFRVPEPPDCCNANSRSVYGTLGIN